MTPTSKVKFCRKIIGKIFSNRFYIIVYFMFVGNNWQYFNALNDYINFRKVQIDLVT